MSKVQSSVRKYVAEFGENIFACDGGILFCKVCEIKVNSVRRFTVTQHLKTDKHIRAVHRKNENKSKFQQLLPNIPDKFMFAKDLCNTLLLTNIPLEKLGNRHVHLFLEKYTGKDIPSVSLLRKCITIRYRRCAIHGKSSKCYNCILLQNDLHHLSCSWTTSDIRKNPFSFFKS